MEPAEFELPADLGGQAAVAARTLFSECGMVVFPNVFDPKTITEIRGALINRLPLSSAHDAARSKYVVPGIPGDDRAELLVPAVEPLVEARLIIYVVLQMPDIKQPFLFCSFANALALSSSRRGALFGPVVIYESKIAGSRTHDGRFEFKCRDAVTFKFGKLEQRSFKSFNGVNYFWDNFRLAHYLL